MVSANYSFNQLPSPNSMSQDQPAQVGSALPPVPHAPNSYYPSPQMGEHRSPYAQPSPGSQPYAPHHPEQVQEAQTSNQYPQYSYDIQLRYPQDPSRPYFAAQGPGLPLPPMATAEMQGQGGPYGAPPPEMMADTTGQVAPPGVKPKVTATLWEDEGTLCFQVDVKGTCVARREDNHMINGTKLLNVAGMTRGRRDGILKSEKQKHVVKIGPMHLKGVWIPFERALEFANKEKITEMLYPLFVHNIGALLYHPINRGIPSAAHIPRSQTQKQEQLSPPPLSNDYRGILGPNPNESPRPPVYS